MYLFNTYRFAFAWTITLIALSVLLIVNTFVYFQTEFVPGFLIEKGEIARNRIWLTAFYFHVVSACVVLVAGTLLFFPKLLNYRRLHKVLGYVYVNCVLWIAAPTGLIMSPFAKGGFPGALGFALTGIVWWYATWRGYRAIRDRQMQEHLTWMIRSWCLSLSAVTFRVLHVGLDLVRVEPLTNYVLSIWLSLIVNAWFAEWVISRSFWSKQVSGPTFQNLLVTSFQKGKS